MTFPRLKLSPPAQWPVAGLSLEVDPVVPTRNEDEVIAAALAHDLPAGTHLTPGDHHGGTSIQGWPVRLVQGRVVDDAGAQRETRLIALYRMIDWLGVVRLIATDRAAWELHRQAVLNAMLAAELELGPGAAGPPSP